MAGAISVVARDGGEVRARLEAAGFVAGSADPSRTGPHRNDCCSASRARNIRDPGVSISDGGRGTIYGGSELAAAGNNIDRLARRSYAASTEAFDGAQAAGAIRVGIARDVAGGRGSRGELFVAQ